MTVIDTFQKQMQPRAAAYEARVQTITIKLSQNAIEQLKSESPARVAQLIKLIDAVYKRPPAAPTPPPATIRVPRTQVDNIVNGIPGSGRPRSRIWCGGWSMRPPSGA